MTGQLSWGRSLQMKIKYSSHQKQTLQRYWTVKVYITNPIQHWIFISLVSTLQTHYISVTPYAVWVRLNTLLLNLASCIPFINYNHEHGYFSPINDAEGENTSVLHEDNSVDQDRAAGVEYLIINNIFFFFWLCIHPSTDIYSQNLEYSCNFEYVLIYTVNDLSVVFLRFKVLAPHLKWPFSAAVRVEPSALHLKKRM